MLISEDIDKKKQALQEESELIQSRLQRRREAEDEYEKYKELEELRAQLSVVSADPTRSRDAIEIQKKIADIEKEIGWDVAENEAEAQQKEIEDKENAYDEYLSLGEEYMDDLLSDANNFADELNEVMSMSSDELFDWLKKNVDEYVNSTETARKDMVENWSDMYDNMFGITKTFWSQVSALMESEEVFMDYMKQSDEYINASDEGKKQLEYNWSELWRIMKAAQQEGAEFNHNDDDLSTDTYIASGSGGGGGSGGGSSSSATPNYNNGGLSSDKVKELQNYLGVAPDGKFGAASQAAALSKFGVTNADAAYNKYIQDKNTVMQKKSQAVHKATFEYPVYATGGLVEHTGFAWVDGTPIEPEAFLSAADTKAIRALLDAVQTIHVPSFASAITSSMFNSASSIGDVYVTINEAEIADDADVDALARLVGEKFVKQIEQQGMNMMNYSM